MRLLLLLLLGCARTGSPPAAAPTVVEPFSAAGIERWAAELVPLVEQAGERSFTEPHPVRFLTPEAFRSFASEEALLVMDRVYAATPRPIRIERAARESDGSLRGLFGKYGLFTGEVYVVHESLLGLEERFGQERAAQMAKVVLAHELAHALQADVYDPTLALDGIVDQDHFLVWTAVNEGGANLIALRVARALGIEDAFWDLARVQGWDADGLQEPGAYDIWMRYGRGMEVLQEVVDTGGMEAFWRWNRRPPLDSAAIFEPDAATWELPESPVDPASLLAGVEQELTRGDWLVASSRLGPWTLRGEALRTGHLEQADRTLAHLRSAWVLDLSLPDRSGDIRHLVFDSPEQARAYVALLRAEATDEARFLAATLGTGVQVEYAAVEVDGDADLLRTQRVPGASGTALESHTGWVVRGPVVVAVTARGFRPGLRLGRTIAAVFDRMP